MQKNALCGRLARGGNRYITKTLLVMKLTVFLLTAAFLNVSASGVSQKISFTGKDVSLANVFAEVKKQTGYFLMYEESMLKGANPVTIDAQDISLSAFMTLVLKDQPLEFTINSKSIFISRKVVPSITLLSDLQSIDIRGRVTNESGEPLVGANIKVNGSNLGASTDDKGYYKIENITAGEYTLIASFVGYATKRSTIKVDEKGTATLDFTLTTSLVNLDEMTVTSTLSKRAIRAYPATIAEIKGKDLQNRNLNNIANALEAIPGIIIQPGNEWYNSGNGGNNRTPTGILIRGTAGNGLNIKYLIDGIEIVSTYGGIGILETIDPNNIDKVEILKGPMASTLYGSGAASGVISITTKKGKVGKTRVNFKTLYTQYANDYANYSGYSQDYSINISGGSEQFNYLIGAAYNLYPTTKLTDINSGIDDKKWSYSGKFGGKLKNISADITVQYGYENSGGGSTDLSYNKYLQSIGLATYMVYPLQDYRYYQRNFLTSLHLSHTIFNNWYHDLTIGYNMNDYAANNYTISSAGTYSLSEYLTSKIDARYFMFYEHPWSTVFKSSITAGFEYNGSETRSMNLSSTTPLINFFSSSTPATAGSASFSKSPYSSTGYFAEIVTGYKNNLFLTTGIRYEINSAYGGNVGTYPQPRIGLSYVVKSGDFNIKPRIAWGVSSQAPDPTYKASYTKAYSFGIYNYVGNPDIKPQRSQGYEFGADLFYSNNYSLNITWYDQKIKDLIQNSFSYDFSTNPTTYISYWFNVGEAINRGLEVSAKAILNPFTIDLSFTQTTSKWGDVIGQTATAAVYPSAPNLGVPKNSLYARLSYKIPSLFTWSKKGGNISFDWRYNGSAYDYDYIRYSLATDAWENAPDPKPAYPDADNYLIWQKGYFYFNLRADYSLTNYAVLYMDVQNLLDKQGSINGQSLSRFPGRRINFGFNITF